MHHILVGAIDLDYPREIELLLVDEDIEERTDYGSNVKMPQSALQYFHALW